MACSPQVEATYLQSTVNEKRNRTMVPLSVRRKSALLPSGQNKRQERHASARKRLLRNSAQEPQPPLQRQSRGAKRRRGVVARNASVRSVKDGRRSAKKRLRRKVGERNELRSLRRRRIVLPSPLRDASPMRDVRAVVLHLTFVFVLTSSSRCSP
jgi:hypothetical protein